ncbi:MAG: hypothetical protein QNJ73_09715 [Gammaproteobacteria bacterium]|nr:hypothetical protein [Gammaproteobacteria bacterium]
MRAGTLASATLAILVLATPVAAEVFYDEARVIDTERIYEPRQVPVQVQQCGYEKPSTPAPVDPATLGDAKSVDPGVDLLGALYREIELREPPADVYRCRMVTRMETKEEFVGYRVRYEYGGRIYERRVAEHPGGTIRVAVRLSANEFWGQRP